ncbi:rod shape-determining protein MreC [Candidatus Roizmanbacteria bacterium]|nr:rod shape-determining protein MreC [Candidatus Roizmanbacteria bacterium]
MRQRIQIIPLFLFLSVVCGALIFSDSNRITYPTRSAIEGYILKIRGNPSVEQASSTDELQSKIISLEKERDILSEENRDLRKQLQAPLPPTYNFIPAIVISKQIEESRAEMLIATGSEEGVAADMPVVSEHILIGLVSDVTPRLSHVKLLSDPEKKIAVKTSRGAQGLVMGSAELGDAKKVFLDRVLQSESLSVGDSVATSGEDGLPPDLLIGEVSEIVTQSRDPLQKAVVTLTIDPRVLKRVFVVRVE